MASADLDPPTLGKAINMAFPAGRDPKTDLKRAAAYFLLMLPPHKHILGTVAQALFNTGINRKSLGVGFRFKTIMRDPLFLFEDVTDENGMINVYVSLDTQRLLQLAGHSSTAAAHRDSQTGCIGEDLCYSRKRRCDQLVGMTKKDKRQKICDAAAAAVAAAGLTHSAALLPPPTAAAAAGTGALVEGGTQSVPALINNAAMLIPSAAAASEVPAAAAAAVVGSAAAALQDPATSLDAVPPIQFQHNDAALPVSLLPAEVLPTTSAAAVAAADGSADTSHGDFLPVQQQQLAAAAAAAASPTTPTSAAAAGANKAHSQESDTTIVRLSNAQQQQQQQFTGQQQAAAAMPLDIGRLKLMQLLQSGAPLPDVLKSCTEELIRTAAATAANGSTAHCSSGR